ncbi:MAG TPA: maltotransferase domain-containing protein [Pirellulales bacterium]|nr:maltotransferase domain-containing protein [Pirellulales bacterium]
MRIDDGTKRVVIEDVRPEVEGGRFPIKRIPGESVIVEAAAFSDAHDVVACSLVYRPERALNWSETSMQPLGQDRWRAEFTVDQVGMYRYTVEAWVDFFLTWRRDLEKRAMAGQVAHVDLLIGANLVREASARAARNEAGYLGEMFTLLSATGDPAARAAAALDPKLLAVMRRFPDKRHAARYDRELAVVVDRPLAVFGAWYEMFPRSCGRTADEHGTLADCAARLPYLAEMGFDVLYLPPITPIGTSYRKGKNNSTVCASDDVGSPWAIGSEAGGHKAIHPQLGTLADFQQLRTRAAELGIELALDVAYQCSPDHPYVREHPEWFRFRPDGTVQYAENPPKKYQDIYPFDFETAHWRQLWDELRSVVLFWIEQGVKIFRVDNPHTKPFGFWQWLIEDVKQRNPEVIFLAEAFTRPRVMQHLAQLGFTQSYTYFAWRNSKSELTDYLRELTQTELAEYFRPNAWPNTPDILTEYLQVGGRPACMARLVLAATLCASYGIYGPAFELCDNRAKEPGSEEYLDSEKYQIRHWNLDDPHSLRHLIARVNHVRRDNPALHTNAGLKFHAVDNDQLICYSKSTPDLSNVILVVVNLDPHHVHSGWVDIPVEELGVGGPRSYQVHDLLSDARFIWQGPRNYVQLDPHVIPAHVFKLRRWLRSEHQFEYFL